MWERQSWFEQVKSKQDLASVAHAYNSSNSGGRDQENPGSKPAPGKAFSRPYLKKKKNHKKGLAEWLKR
jgi:hypothetical protein